MKPDDSIRIERHGFTRLYLCEGVQADEVLKALAEPGDPIKHGNKRIVRKIGDWVIKTTRMNGGIGPLKMTLNRARYRNAWLSSLEMIRLGLRVPKTIAYVEHGALGAIWGNAFVYEYLEDCLPALQFLEPLIKKEDRDSIDAFFTNLAEAVTGLAEAKVFHRDLKLDNVLTPDGREFFFIDLDEALINQPFEPKHRMRNHIQMGNGLWRICDKPDIDAFLQRTVPNGEDRDAWIDRVWVGIKDRRGTGEWH